MSVSLLGVSRPIRQHESGALFILAALAVATVSAIKAPQINCLPFDAPSAWTRHACGSGAHGMTNRLVNG